MNNPNPNHAYRPENVRYNTTEAPVDALGRTGDNTAADTAAVQQIFQDTVGRAAGTAGANYYAQQLGAGKSLDQIRAEVSGSTEGQQFAETGQQRYVAEAKQVQDPAITYNTTDQSIDALGRTGDNTAADMAALQTIYQNQTGRAMGVAGRDWYQGQLNTGTNLDTLRAQIAASDESTAYKDTGQQS